MSWSDDSGEPRKPNWPQLAVVALFVGIVLLAMLWAIVNPQNPDERTNLLKIFFTIIGGIGFAIGLYFTYQTVENARETVRITKETAEATRAASDRQELNERFHKASELLSSSSEAAKIGALFSLERMSRESDVTYSQCMELVCAFLRSRSLEIRSAHESVLYGDKVERVPEDMAVAVEVLTRRANKLGDGEREGLKLRGVNLSGLIVEDGNFERADLSHAIARETTFRSCSFAWGSLEYCDARGAIFMDTAMVRTDLSHADLSHALIQVTPRAFNLDLVAIQSQAGVSPVLSVGYERADPQFTPEGGPPEDLFETSIWYETKVEFLSHNFRHFDGLAALDGSQRENLTSNYVDFDKILESANKLRDKEIGDAS